MDHTARPGSVADPWYTDDFEATWREMQAFFQYTTKRAAKKENPCILSPMGVEYSRQTNTGELVEAG